MGVLCGYPWSNLPSDHAYGRAESAKDEAVLSRADELKAGKSATLRFTLSALHQPPGKFRVPVRPRDA
eukprot:5309700-Prymnesium_polylepis.2